jgi:hypothetical protein
MSLKKFLGDFSKFVTLEILAEFKVEIESIEQQIIEQLHRQRERIKQIQQLPQSLRSIAPRPNQLFP